MNCKQINKKLIFYIDKSLSDEEMLQVSSHIEECESCKQISDMLVSSLNIIDEEKSVIVNPYLHTRVLQTIKNRRKRALSTYQMSFKRVLQPILYSAILIVGISFGITLGNMATGSAVNTFADNDINELFFNDFDQEPIELFLLNQ